MARAGYPSDSLFPGEDVFPGEPDIRALFDPPTDTVAFRMEGHLYGTVERGLTLWRSAGVWHTSWTPSATDLASADLVFEGGRIHEIGTDAVTALTAAGYGARITTLEVT